MGHKLQEMSIHHFDQSNSDETLEWGYIFEHTNSPLLTKLVVLCTNYGSGIFEAIRTGGTLFDPAFPAPEELYPYFFEHIPQAIRVTSDRETIARFLEERLGRGRPLRRVYMYDARPRPLLVIQDEDTWRMSAGGAVVECVRSAMDKSPTEGVRAAPRLAT
ncbi:uncharacterized protein STEHIDRAFT_156243 [Stereum hirsutum FP-91666 SS1]|uniref:uncharacterized protein n=1 Tax=Stereum hirsutum (strain FP-91666) TaxID=721885 RepID=UPI000440E234|nr:uncharacterized protein STEHIDRAFT_156243 [Stereum hirsutum FP-91666 SS1]EIM87257.1 hypothetical protein STEHIDRAFT_156243 [Stereum hirsutum FP-91666 SS1]